MFNKSFQFRYIKKKLLLNLKLPEGLLSPSAQAILDKENTYVSVVLIAEFVSSQIIQMLLPGTCLLQPLVLNGGNPAPHQTRLWVPWDLWVHLPWKGMTLQAAEALSTRLTLIPSSMVGIKLFFQFNKSNQVDMLFLKHCFVPQWSDIRCSLSRHSKTMPTSVLPTVCPLP